MKSSYFFFFPAFFFLYMFHGMNAVMFNIGMFSYMCMAMIPIFCRPDWPKMIIRRCPNLLQLFLPLTSVAQTNNDDCIYEETIDAKSEIDDGNSDAGVPKKKNKNTKKTHGTPTKCSLMKCFRLALVSIYVIIQIVLPYSHSITKVATVFNIYSLIP